MKKYTLTLFIFLLALSPSRAGRFTGSIVISAVATETERYAALELQRYLYQVTGEKLVIETATGSVKKGSFILGLSSTNRLIRDMVADEAGPQGYILRKIGRNVVIAGDDPVGVLYGVYGLLEDHYGVRFYMGGDVLPESMQPLIPKDLDEVKAPAVAIRGFLPWTNFPQSATSYSWEDWKFIIDQMAKMRMNFLHIHNYNGEAGHNEMFHNFTFNGIRSRVWMATARTGHGWACPPWDVNNYLFGASDLFDDYDFGSKVAMHNETLSNEAVSQKGANLFQRVIVYAHQRGVKVGLGLDIDLILPEYQTDADNPDVVAARVDDICTHYPDLDYLLCFQSEGIATRTDLWKKWRRIFDGFYEGMKSRSPHTRLAVAGWGINPENTATLPADVICAPISAYSDGCESGAIYGDREYWGCPWLERDFNSSEYYYPYNMHLSNTLKAWNDRAPNMKGFYCLTWRLTDAIDPKMWFISKAPWYETQGLTSGEVYYDYAVYNYGKPAADVLTRLLDQNEPVASLFGECQATPPFAPPGSGDYLLNVKALNINDMYHDISVVSTFNDIQKAPCSEGGECIGFIRKNSWFRFDDIDFGKAATEMTIRVASATRGGIILIRLDSLEGKEVGSCTVNNTQGWQSWIDLPVTIAPTGGRHDLYFQFAEKTPVSDMPEYEKALSWLKVIDSCLAGATPSQKVRLGNLRCRIAAEADHVLLNERFSDPEWKEMPEVMQDWARNFTHRVTDISSLGNVMSSQNRFVQLNYLPVARNYPAPPKIDAPLHPVVVSPPLSTLEGQAAPIEVRVLDSKDFPEVSAVLHWRMAGEPDWKSVPMVRRVKAIFFSVVPPAGLTEYFITISEGDRVARWPVSGTRTMITIPGPAPSVGSSPAVRAVDGILEWTAIDRADLYRIYRCDHPDFSPGPATLVTWVPASVLSFTDGAPGFSGKSLASTQYYKVTAVDANGNESPAGDPVSVAHRIRSRQ